MLGHARHMPRSLTAQGGGAGESERWREGHGDGKAEKPEVGQPGQAWWELCWSLAEQPGAEQSSPRRTRNTTAKRTCRPPRTGHTLSPCTTCCRLHWVHPGTPPSGHTAQTTRLTAGSTPLEPRVEPGRPRTWHTRTYTRVLGHAGPWGSPHRTGSSRARPRGTRPGLATSHERVPKQPPGTTP